MKTKHKPTGPRAQFSYSVYQQYHKTEVITKLLVIFNQSLFPITLGAPELNSKQGAAPHPRTNGHGQLREALGRKQWLVPEPRGRPALFNCDTEFNNIIPVLWPVNPN